MNSTAASDGDLLPRSPARPSALDLRDRAAPTLSDVSLSSSGPASSPGTTRWNAIRYSAGCSRMRRRKRNERRRRADRRPDLRVTSRCVDLVVEEHEGVPGERLKHQAVLRAEQAVHRRASSCLRRPQPLEPRAQPGRPPPRSARLPPGGPHGCARRVHAVAPLLDLYIVTCYVTSNVTGDERRRTCSSSSSTVFKDLPAAFARGERLKARGRRSARLASAPVLSEPGRHVRDLSLGERFRRGRAVVRGRDSRGHEYQPVLRG